MAETHSGEGLAATIRELYAIVGRLESEYHEHSRHFTLDGHLVGSIGEVYAAERYGIKLLTSSAPTHDGTAPDGRLVQIKATQRNSIALNDNPDFLIVLRIDERGENTKPKAKSRRIGFVQNGFTTCKIINSKPSLRKKPSKLRNMRLPNGRCRWNSSPSLRTSESI